MILKEWTRITKTVGADVVVLDMPLLDTRARTGVLTGRFVADLTTFYLRMGELSATKKGT